MFTFKFEASLTYRKLVEERKLAAFMEVQAKQARETEILEGLQAEQRRIKGQFRKMQEEVFNAPEVALYLSYLEMFKEKEVLQQETVRKVILEVEAARKELLDAVKERKIMENLKERQLKEYNAAQAGHERKRADETAVISFIRNKQ
jgi:flagellar FliJ protein